MNTKAPIWNDYIASFTRPPLLSVIVSPVRVQAAQPVTLCAIRLPDKVRYVDGVQITREQWSHTAYAATVEGDWIRVSYGAGCIYRKQEQVRFADVVVGIRKAA
jgi:hypothetical protein